MMRSIIKMLLANLRHKKGSFTGVIILMTILTLSYAITINNTRNLEQTADESFTARQIGDLIFQLYDSPSAEITDVLRSHPEIAGIREEHHLVMDAPMLINGEEYTDIDYLRCEQDTDLVFGGDLKSLYAHTPLNPGEVYLSYKLSRAAAYAPGSRIRLVTGSGSEEIFTVRGYYQEVVDNTQGIMLLCPSDFDRLYAGRDDVFDSGHVLFGTVELHISLQKGTDLRALEKALKEECSLYDEAWTVSTKEELWTAVTVMTSTGTRILAVYVLLLVVIVLIVIGNSIGTAVETEYVNLGILKAVGFGKKQLRAVWFLQYSLAVLIGSVLGIVLSVPATEFFGSLFSRLSNIVTSNAPAVGRCALAASAILLVCMIYVVLATSRIGRISPVRAISGGHSEIYFDSRLQMRIRKRGLSFFLAMRQLTSRMRSYLGSLMIVSLLVFFLCTVMIFTGGINADLFVTPTGDIEMNMLSGTFTQEHEPELRALCDRYDPEAEILLWTGRYMYAEDEKTLAEDYHQKAMFTNPLEGRVPDYGNEITVTELFAQKMQKQIGDTVTVKYGGKRADFVITGFIQSVHNLGGAVIQMTDEGGRRIGVEAPDRGYVQLTDLSQKTALTDALNSEMSEYFTAKEFEPNAYMKDILDTVDIIMKAVKWAVYSVTLLFAAVVVTMICRRTFLKERTDIGIFKAVGFSVPLLRRPVPLLRRQFAERFLLIAVIGSAVGCAAAALFSRRLLSVLMRFIGISRFGADFTWEIFLLPALAVSAAFFLFAYFASRRVRSVSVRELISE